MALLDHDGDDVKQVHKRFTPFILRLESGSVFIYDSAFRDVDVIKDDTRYFCVHPEHSEIQFFDFDSIVEARELSDEEWCDLDQRGIMPRFDWYGNHINEKGQLLNTEIFIDELDELPPLSESKVQTKSNFSSTTK